jgi:demethylmenaquinone methyltransferase/2-methoxy-6-polyprenyl-1,4-benzoquinol methylase
MDKVSFGFEEVSPEEKTERVGRVFANVASRYDLMNDLMSGGMHRHWKNMFVRRVRPRKGETILEVGRERAARQHIEGLEWSEQNAETLSFASASFDAYTIAFGIRNVTHIAHALSEAHRVLKLGGRFFCLEFSTTEWPGFATIYERYSMHIVPKIGKAVAQDEDSYRYLVESIRRFPPMPVFKTMIEKAGFTQVKAEPILGGLVAIHSGWKV